MFATFPPRNRLFQADVLINQRVWFNAPTRRSPRFGFVSRSITVLIVGTRGGNKRAYRFVSTNIVLKTFVLKNGKQRVKRERERERKRRDGKEKSVLWSNSLFFFFFAHPRNVITLRIFRRFIYERFVCSDQSPCLTDIGRTVADDSINFWLSIPSSILLLVGSLQPYLRGNTRVKLKVSRQLEIMSRRIRRNNVDIYADEHVPFRWSIANRESRSHVKLLSGLQTVGSTNFL